MGRAGGVPGRMEAVDEGQAFIAVVDYAHKPDAVTAVLGSVRPATAGRVIVVLGAGGDRDRGKREVMGEIAARRADVVVVTDDNPRSEDPADDPGRAAGRCAPRRRPSCTSRATARAAIALAVELAALATAWWWPARATRPGRRSPAWSTPSTTARCCGRRCVAPGRCAS